jgi:hypothetical protein
MKCMPPSGSLFPVATTTVNCTAPDAAGNQAECAFTVTVRPSALRIERAIILRWECGVLQCADRVGGPYVDVPGTTRPYCVSAEKPRRFYRVRN